MQVTETVAGYSVLRKMVDEFSHGGAGWQGLVTENCSSAKTQPCLDRDLRPRGAALCLVVLSMPALGGLHLPWQAKREQRCSFPPLPLPVTNARFPGARKFLSFSENAFGLVFSGTDML